MMTVKECYAILELTESATINDVKDAYRELSLYYHPDRAPKSPRAQSAAQAKMKAVNEAYSTLKKHLETAATQCPRCGNALSSDKTCPKCDDSRQAHGSPQSNAQATQEPRATPSWARPEPETNQRS